MSHLPMLCERKQTRKTNAQRTFCCNSISEFSTETIVCSLLPVCSFYHNEESFIGGKQRSHDINIVRMEPKWILYIVTDINEVV